MVNALYETEEEKKTFFKGSTDRVFKSIFVNVDDFHMMEALLTEVLKTPVKIIKYYTNDLNIKDVKEKVKTVDVLLEVDGMFMNLEVNTSNSEGIRIRNFNYFMSFYVEKTRIGEVYDITNKFTLLNLNFNDKRNYLTKTFKIKLDKVEKCQKKDSYNMNETYVPNIEIIEVNVDKIKEFCYNRSGSRYEILPLLTLGKEELESVDIKNEVGKEFRDKIMALNEDSTFHYDLTREERDLMAFNTDKKIAREQGEKLGIAKGKKVGSAEEKKAIALKMIGKYSHQEISDITGLSIEHVKKLSSVKENDN